MFISILEVNTYVQIIKWSFNFFVVNKSQIKFTFDLYIFSQYILEFNIKYVCTFSILNNNIYDDIFVIKKYTCPLDILVILK